MRIPTVGVAPVMTEIPERRKRWEHLIESDVMPIKNKETRWMCEALLDNQAAVMQEATETGDVTAFTTFSLPLVRRVYPNLIANEIVSVQPMSQPTGKVFFLDFKYGTTRSGGATLDDRMDDLAERDIDYANATPSSTVREVDLAISSEDISASSKKLKAKWQIEAQQDLKAYHGLEAENELIGMMALEILLEIDETILDDLVTTATAGNVNWAKTVPTSGAYSTLDPIAYKKTLYEAIIDAEVMIFNKRYRNATFLVADATTCARLEKLSGFDMNKSSNPDWVDTSRMTTFHGIIEGKWKLYKAPLFQADKILVGYKGSSWMDTGYVYAPYIPMFITDTIIDPNDFVPRKGMMTRFAKKSVVPTAYATVTLTT